MRAIRQAVSREDLETVHGLLREYQMRLGIDLSFQHFEEELKDLPGGYAPPGGRLLLLAPTTISRSSRPAADRRR